MDPNEVLTTNALFDGVPDQVLATIADISKEVEHFRGELIFEEGEKAEHLYILVEGKVSIRAHLTSRPESITVAILNQSDQSFGWSCVVAPFCYTASALCETDCRLLAIPG
ncbi:MAG: cyclic nucleotide-binding domain-containing protein [Anaerolineales bacterium]|nr:cyclic nucleotide-binding domain-containing protein [Anaerolineales bacterium]